MSENLKEMKEFLLAWNEKHTEVFYEAEKTIWNNPELSMQEHESAKVLIELLKDAGFTVESGNVAGMPTAFIASYGEGKPVIGINAEYDALPGLSQQEKIQRKQEKVLGGPGHGCGHNLLGTGGVKAAIAVKNALEHFHKKGTIKVFGTPAEELCVGKVFMGKAGCFEGVDAFLDWHPWSYNRADYDSCCAYFSIKYHFTGRTSHGNSPWYGRSALDAALLQAHAVEMMREHIDPGCPPDAANTVNYTFTHTGPEIPSVVPDKTTAWYVGRFVTTEKGMDALRRIGNCAKGAALATETEVEEELITATHHKIPNKTLAEILHRNFQLVGVPSFTPQEQEKAKAIQRSIGVEEKGLATEMMPFGGGHTVVCDTSEFSWNAPYASAWIAMGMEGCGWHHWGVTACAGDTMGQKSMDTAAKVISLSAIELYCDEKRLREAQDEFRQRMGDKTYQCLLPDHQQPPVSLNRKEKEE